MARSGWQLARQAYPPSRRNLRTPRAAQGRFALGFGDANGLRGAITNDPFGAVKRHAVPNLGGEVGCLLGETLVPRDRPAGRAGGLRRLVR